VRPLLAGPDRAEKYRELMNSRVPLYRRVATIRINTNRRNPGAVVRHIVGRLENPEPPRRRRAPWRRVIGGGGATAAPQPDTPGAAEVAAPHHDSPAESGPVTPATLARRAGLRK
jgi:shikimate kinase